MVNSLSHSEDWLIQFLVTIRTIERVEPEAVGSQQVQIPICTDRQIEQRSNRALGFRTFFLLDFAVPLCYLYSTVLRKPNPSSGVPIYVQLKEQIRHGIETGALLSGDPLPGIRSLADTLVVNPNTVIRVYRELEQEGMLEIRHGLGAFISMRRR